MTEFDIRIIDRSKGGEIILSGSGNHELGSYRETLIQSSDFLSENQFELVHSSTEEGSLNIFLNGELRVSLDSGENGRYAFRGHLIEITHQAKEEPLTLVKRSKILGVLPFTEISQGNGRD